jgi:DNA-binding transcriptional LysR family regulator
MMSIHSMNVAGFDLNLLLALEALVAERSVTRAARRVGVSQPAMSNSLARLRVALGDPLLVRARIGMTPTSRALELQRDVAAALALVRRALGERAAFDPASASRVFTVAASDYVSFVLLAPLAQRLAQVAPGVALRIVPLAPDLSPSDLESGALDLTLGFFRKVPPGLRRARLFRDGFVGVVREGHPILKTPRSATAVAALRHLRVAPQGEQRGLLDVAFERQGLRRHVALTVPHFLLALEVARTDLFVVLPERLAVALSRHAALRILTVPAPLPTITIEGFWHARVHEDPAHAWLRGLVAEVAAGSVEPEVRRGRPGSPRRATP